MNTLNTTVATDSLLTPEEAADYLRVNARTLERWRCDGGGPQFAKIGRRVAYRPSDLNAFVEQRLFSHTSQKKLA